jgi:LPS sulfotransferase NodH
MIHGGRSGSTVLADLFRQASSIEDIYWIDEVYAPILRSLQDKRKLNFNVRNYNPDDYNLKCYLERRISNCKSKSFGFEFKPYQLRLFNQDLVDYIEHIKSLGCTKFISLRRKNILRKIVSSNVGVRYKIWHSKNKNIGNLLKRVYIDPNNTRVDNSIRPMIDIIKEFEDDFETFQSMVNEFNPLTLYYEDDILNDPLIGCNKLTSFLGLTNLSIPTVRYQRINPLPLKTVIINFDEVKSYLSNTKYEWMVYE